MHQDIECSKPAAAVKAAKDLADPPFDAVPNDRVADLAASGDSETRTTLIVGVDVQGRELAASLLAASIAAQEVYSPAQSLVAAKPLVPLRGHAS